MNESVKTIEQVREKHNAFLQSIKTPEERFWEKVKKTEFCWNWFGGINFKGYGVFRVFTNLGMTAHRFSWIIHNSEIPKGLFVCHKCDNPKCVNPDHLFLGTNFENVMDRVRKDRTPKGINNYKAKLTDDAVKMARQLYASGEGYIKIGKRFGVNCGTIQKAVIRKTWKHVP